MVDLRRKSEDSNAHVKFKNNSTILDEILESQRPPNEKSSLGHNQKVEISEVDILTPNYKHDTCSSSSKGESEVINQEPMQSKGNLRRLEQEGHP